MAEAILSVNLPLSASSENGKVRLLDTVENMADEFAREEGEAQDRGGVALVGIVCGSELTKVGIEVEQYLPPAMDLCDLRDETGSGRGPASVIFDNEAWF
jgi:hypothetical protein